MQREILKKDKMAKVLKAVKEFYKYRYSVTKDFHVEISQERDFIISLTKSFMQYLPDQLREVMVRRIKRLERIAENRGYEMEMESWKSAYAWIFRGTG